MFHKDGFQTGQGPSRNSNSPRFSGWNEDSRLPKHRAKPFEALHCCRVGFKVTSDWKGWIIRVYTRTDLQNLPFPNTLVLSSLGSLCSSLWQHRRPGRAESSRDGCQPAGQAAAFLHHQPVTKDFVVITTKLRDANYHNSEHIISSRPEQLVILQNWRISNKNVKWPTQE